MFKHVLAMVGVTFLNAWNLAQSPNPSPNPHWVAESLPIELQVGYAVRAVDLSGDGRLDLAITDSKRWVWLENPTWQVHVMHATPEAAADNVCFAEQDIDQDGQLDFAVGHDWQPNNTESGGAIGWLKSPKDPRQPWSYHPIATLPTTHRMGWADLQGEEKPKLIVVPLKGRGSVGPEFDQTPIEIMQFEIPTNPAESVWPSKVLNHELHVAHNFEVRSDPDRKSQDLLIACFEGVQRLYLRADGTCDVYPLGEGHEGKAPARGASEVRSGHLRDGTYFFAAIEPWHGNQVVIYGVPNDRKTRMFPRLVIDNELQWGHAVWVGDIDGDPDDEVVIGVRDDLNEHRRGVRVYDYDGSVWRRSLIEPGQVAVEDMTVADLDGDGKRDIIAVGRATHNAVIYWNR